MDRGQGWGSIQHSNPAPLPSPPPSVAFAPTREGSGPVGAGAAVQRDHRRLGRSGGPVAGRPQPGKGAHCAAWELHFVHLRVRYWSCRGSMAPVAPGTAAQHGAPSTLHGTPAGISARNDRI